MLSQPANFYDFALFHVDAKKSGFFKGKIFFASSPSNYFKLNIFNPTFVPNWFNRFGTNAFFR